MSRKFRIAAFKLLDILVIFTMAFGSPMGAAAATLSQDAGPTLSADKTEYTAGETARLDGSGFVPGDYVLRANGTEWSTVTADENGAFVTNSPALDATGTYDVQALASADGTLVASASFTVSEAVAPTEVPTQEPTTEPTEEPTAEPTHEPTAEPTDEPTVEPTEEPTAEPTEEPTVEPTEEPTVEPTEEPTATPSTEPTNTPTAEPTEEPTATATAEPTATLPPTPSEPPYIQSGKEDYAPGELVTLTGENWQGDAEVRIVVNDDVGQTWRREVTVTVAGDGTIADSFNLPTFFVATYTVVAIGLQTDRVARTTFTDKPAVNLDQCANLGTTCNTGTSSQWQNGNLGSSQARYFEGDSVPYRAVLTGLEAGQTYTLTIEYDTTQSGKHALDYLTTFNRTETTANPCSGVAGVPSCASSSFPIPLDPNVSGAGVTQLSGQNFTVYNGTITGTSAYTLSGTYGGNSSTSITLTFTATANGTTIIAWGGHIATRADWGANNSAVSISGSPYHMRLVTFTCSNVSNCSVGQQDRSLSAEAVVFPASITIIKAATPEGSTSFPFSASPASLSSFSLVDDGSSTNTQVFSSITNFTTYTVTENTTSGWTLTGITCSVTSPNGGSQSVSLPSVSIDLREGENVTCTFANTLTAAPSLSINKTVTDVDGAGPSGSVDEAGDVISYQIVVNNTGNVTLTSVTVSDPLLGTLSCTWPGTADTLGVGQSVTCTGSYTAAQGDIDGNGGGDGDIDNTATADSDQTGPSSDSEVVPIVQSAALTLDKTATPSTYDSVGDAISYSYLVTNTGNVSLAGPVTITDDKATDEACPDVSTVGNGNSLLDPGESITCTASYTIAQADLNSGAVTNIAQAHAGGTDSNTDTETVTAVQTPSLSLVKTATPATYDSVGDVISYNYQVTNTGNVRLAGPVTVTDDKATDESCPNVNTVGNLDTFLDPGESITCTASYTITQVDLNAGSVTNIAQAHADGTDSNTDTETVNADQTSALTLIKTATPTSYDEAGDVISYSYLVTNIGNVSLTGPVTITDDKATDEACPDVNTVGNLDTFLDPGESITCTASYTITQADLNNGSVTNVASAHADGTVSNQDTETVTADQSPALTLVKTAAPSSYDSAGDVISYSYLVTNTGNVTLYDITVVDDKASVTCPDTSGGLAPTAQITCTASYTVTQADLDSGSVTNTAYATDGTTDSEPDSETVTADQNPALSIVKTADPLMYESVGDVISYSYLVTNTGNVTLYSISVADDKATVTCPDTSDGLAPTAQITCSASYSITQADLDSGSVTNTAYATDGTTDSEPDSETVDAIQSPALSIVKTGAWVDGDNDGFADAGEVINYTFAVKNEGNVTLHNVTVTDTVGGVTISGSPTTLDVGETDAATFTGTYTLTQADIDAGHFFNTATADSDESGPDDDDHNQPLPQNPALTVEKTGTFDPGANGFADPGDLITYEFTVTNTGNVTLTNVTVTDPLVGPITCSDTTIPVGGSITCSATYAVTQADIDAGSVYNLATADSDESDPDTDDETVNLPQNPALMLEKTGTFDAGADGYADPGEIITYTFVVTNTGNVTLTNVTVTDPLPSLSTITCDANTIPVGSFITCTATYAVTQDDIDAGTVYNLATADSDESQEDTDDNEEPLPQNPALTLVKTGTFDAGADGYADPGEIISYTFVVTNTGNVTLTNVTVTDPLAGLSVITCDGATIPVGGFITCTATYAVTQADIDAGFVTNLATADSDESEPDDDDNNEPLPQNHALTVEKTADPISMPEPGGAVTFTVRVNNTGNTTLSLTSLQDNIYGDIADNTNPALNDTTCSVPQTISVSGFYECTFNGDVTGEPGLYTDTVSATANNVTASDDATVELTDVAPTITVDKSADPTSLPEPGGDVEFTVVVTNNSFEPVTLTSLTDDIYGDLNGQGTCVTGGTIAAAASYSCTFTGAVSGEPGFYTDVVTAVATDNDGTTAEDFDDATVELTDVAPSVNLAKDVTPASYPEPGGLFTYTLTITNNSVETVTITTLTDTNALSAQCLALVNTTLAAGASTSCTYTVTHTDAGSYPNTASVIVADNENNTASDSDDETVTVTDELPAVTLDKSASPTTLPEPGGLFTFTLTITNDSVEEVSITALTDDNALSAECTALIGTTLAAGASTSCTYTVTHTDAGSYPNTASVTVQDDEGNPATDTDDETVTVTDVAPTVTIVKSADPTTLPEPGGVFTFTLTITNTSVESVEITALTDSNALSAQCLALVGTTLAAGASTSCQYAVTHTNAGSYDNTASVTVEDNEDNQAADSDDETVTVQNVNPVVSIVKSASPTTLPEPGGVFTFTLTITNDSNASDPFTITDLSDTQSGATDFSACEELVGTVLDPGEFSSCQYTVTHTDAGSYDNTATVRGTDDEGNEASDSDDETVTVTDVVPTVDLTKSATPSSLPEPGGVFTFTLTIHNTSVEAVTITALTDDNVLSQECLDLINTTLAAGDSTSCTYTVTHTDAGTYPNTASVTVADNEGNSASDSDDETVTVTDVRPSITVEKTANPTAVPETGANVTFSFKVTNTSVEPVTITSLSDSDFGILTGDADCQVGTILTVGSFCTFSEDHFISGDFESGISHNNVFTAIAKDNENNTASDDDDATVTFTDVTAQIDVEKYVSVDNGANWHDADSPTGPFTTEGSTVNFKFVVTNNSSVPLSSITLSDSDFNLSSCPPIPATLAPGASYECIITTTAITGQHTNTATASGSFTDGADNTESDTDTDDANYYGLIGGQPSIAIKSLSININRTRTTVNGQFNITDESEGGNQPDGFLVVLTSYGVRWETKTSARNSTFQPVTATSGCTYTLVASDVPQAAGWTPGDPIIFDESVTIGYTCNFGSTQLPKGGTLRGTAYAELFGRPGHVFTFSNTAVIPK